MPVQPREAAPPSEINDREKRDRIVEFWECDPPTGWGTEREGEWTDDAVREHYLRDVGADTYCRCGHTADAHGWQMGSQTSICLTCYRGTHNGVHEGCARFAMSPFKCPVCRASHLDFEAAIECCICLECGHVFEQHRKRSATSVVPEGTTCQERACRCRGFGLGEFRAQCGEGEQWELTST